MSDEISLVDCCLLPILWRLPRLGIELPRAAAAARLHGAQFRSRGFPGQSFRRRAQHALSEVINEFESSVSGTSTLRVDRRQRLHAAPAGECRLSGVQVPAGYASDGQIVLNVAPSAVRHLHMDNEAISFEGALRRSSFIERAVRRGHGDLCPGKRARHGVRDRADSTDDDAERCWWRCRRSDRAVARV